MMFKKYIFMNYYLQAVTVHTEDIRIWIRAMLHVRRELEPSSGDTETPRPQHAGRAL